ncbi:MAG: hypothetical protein QG670_1718 [Thermoproteota archaeon]|nr:hypothetical protein [Thermoproteota archaeon]
MMSRISDIVRESLSGKDEIECVLPSQHEKTAGYIVLSKEKMIFVDEDLLTHQNLFSQRASRPPFEIPLWAIVKIEVGLNKKNPLNQGAPFAVILNDGDAYIFKSIFSTEIKKVFENSRNDEPYNEAITVMSQV